MAALILFAMAMVFLPAAVSAATTIGNAVSVGTTLNVGGATVLSSTLAVTGSITPGSDNLYDIGASSTQWRYGNFQQGLLIADGSNTSTLTKNSLILTQGASDILGKFYVDSSGNVSASGTLTATGATVLNGAVTLGDSVGDSIVVTGKLGTLKVSSGTTTSTHANNSLTLGESSSDLLGKFYVDSSGNVSASGTLT
ncbi:MAG: hypothetical protein AAB568_00130, partial [Patescibacteria group bacterium]